MRKIEPAPSTMVYKVTKAGVRSGNTLRCTHSVKAKRYSRQTCLVSRSNLCPDEIPKLLDSSEDTLVNSTLSSTDVILSLNKKARWRVPAEISHMIKMGHVNKGKTMVSFLERHKLKRTANCVRFVSNQERLGQVVPRPKKYFSFNLNNIDRDLSNRKLKQQKGAKMEQPRKVRLMTDNRKDIMKTVEVFTVSGSGKAADVKKCLASSKPEYRIEVFYPSPKSCSLTYNPKYTDVHMEFGQDGKMEIKSNAKPQKGTRRHRKRFSLKDLRLYDEELNANGETELWYGENEENDSDVSRELDVSSLDNKNDCEHFISLSEKENKNELVDEERQLFDNTIASFIVQAEKESHRRSLVPQGKKHLHRHSKEKANSSGLYDKSHIVHISKTGINDAKDSPSSSYSTLHSAKVILRSSEISPEKLRATFGCWYQEGNSEPRRFTINLTEDVNNLLKPTHDPEHEGAFIAYLVFVHAGNFDEDLDVFKVIFNSNCCKESQQSTVIKNIRCNEMSIHVIMKRVVYSLNDMKRKKLLSIHHKYSRDENSVAVANVVHKFLMENNTDCHSFREVLGNFQLTEERAISSPRVNILKELDYDIFCDSCYEHIDADSISWTKLLACSHLFCDECWRSHFRSTTKTEHVKLSCPASNCDAIVDVVTLLSLLHVSEVSQLLVRALEDDQSTLNWKPCPATDCGRIVSHKTEKNAKFDVLCSCGHGFCFLCLSEPHWPCDCKQAEKYLEELRKLKPVEEQDLRPGSHVSEVAKDAESNEDEVFEIESRICPKCFSFIEKHGSYSHMICKCGHEFCWNCLTGWKKHKDWKCIPCVPYVLKYTQRVTVRHLETPTLFTLEGESVRPNADLGQYKATMYNKALEQRLEGKRNLTEKQIQEILSKIAYIAQHRLPGKKEILTTCGVQFSDVADSKLHRYPLLPAVENFLRSCQEHQRVVHHLAEFSFVLLKDMPASAEKRRAMRLLPDLLCYCNFMMYVLDLDPDPYQDVRIVIRQLADIRKWSRRAMTALGSSIEKLKGNN